MNNIKGNIIQYQGPFSNGYSISFPSIATVRFGVQLSIKDMMENPNFYFQVNMRNSQSPTNIYLGQTAMYESDDYLPISSISFPQGAPPSFTLEYIIL